MDTGRVRAHDPYWVAPPDRQLTHWMPWQKFAGFADDEVTALYEYLKTISVQGTTTSR